MMSMFRRISARRKVEGLIRDGVGLQENRWPAPRTDSEAERLSADILEWVRGSMGGMRRPYGINHVALALACRDSEGKVLVTNALGVARPETYWGHEGAERINGFLGDVESIPPRQRTEVVGALLSLGDLAYAIHEARAA